MMSKRKPYHRPLKNDWWLKKLFFTKYMLREGSSIFIAIYSLILAWGLFRLNQGETAFNAWLAPLQHPLAIIFHLIALAFALYHSITWFSLAPKALDLWINKKPVQDKVIILGHYIAFLLIIVLCFAVIMI